MAHRISAPLEVIVATRNRPEDLARLVPTLQAQSFTDFAVTIIDQSDDHTLNRDLIAALQDARFTIISQHERGKSKALNLALSEGSAPLLVFTDDDCTMAPDWLARIVSVADANPEVGLIFGSVSPAPHDAEIWFIPAILLTGPEHSRGR